MNPETRETLERIRDTATPAFRARASEILAGAGNWTDREIDLFIDGYFNDPYLTRNPGDRP